MKYLDEAEAVAPEPLAITTAKVYILRTEKRIDEAKKLLDAEENRKKVESKGGIVLTTTHAFTGIGGAMRKKFSMYLLGDVIANTLRIFGQGMKVVCEISLMAADAGLVQTGEDIIAIAGTGRGADTAVVLKPVNTNDFFDLRVREILCKPHF